MNFYNKFKVIKEGSLSSFLSSDKEHLDKNKIKKISEALKHKKEIKHYSDTTASKAISNGFEDKNEENFLQDEIMKEKMLFATDKNGNLIFNNKNI